MGNQDNNIQWTPTIIIFYALTAFALYKLYIAIFGSSLDFGSSRGRLSGGSGASNGDGLSDREKARAAWLKKIENMSKPSDAKKE